MKWLQSIATLLAALVDVAGLFLNERVSIFRLQENSNCPSDPNRFKTCFTTDLIDSSCGVRFYCFNLPLASILLAPESVSWGGSSLVS
ncbi:hypothetical protein JOE21_000589 [Desmospora profundinema]|uniref:Secreted protein n=1 Tax=Desmospora profundinema TaxID=1571184 RepID=A0ABU1IIS6_9BACL|nr:hypothetical protein [Desmospora profundinema]